MNTSATTRRDWFPQVIALILLAFVGTLPFWLTDLDIRVASVFYHPEADEPWFESRQALWLFLYQAAPLLIALIMLGSLAVLAAAAIWPRFRRLQLTAVFLIAMALIGPGLIVNVVLKDHWGRPRPHQTIELGGTHDYLPPLARGEAGKGKSFPCGHSSAGYMLAAFFLVWRRHRPWLARLALIGSIGLGTLLGIGRMTAGDHFLSDVIWSGVIVYGLALFLYHVVLRIPQREAAAASTPAPPIRPLRYPLATGAAYGVTAGAMLFGVLLATPVHENRSQAITAADYRPSPRTLRLIADTAQVSITWHDWTDRTALILLKGRGFGLPGTRVRDSLEVQDGVLNFQISHEGLFTEKDTSLVVGLVPSDWDRVEVTIGAGDIRVGMLNSVTPQLLLETADGRVLRDAD